MNKRLVALANSLGGDDEDTIMAAVAQISQAAAFLDGLANQLHATRATSLERTAAECRAMVPHRRRLVQNALARSPKVLNLWPSLLSAAVSGHLRSSSSPRLCSLMYRPCGQSSDAHS